jgi:hypothetical protein
MNIATILDIHRNAYSGSSSTDYYDRTVCLPTYDTNELIRFAGEPKFDQLLSDEMNAEFYPQEIHQLCILALQKLIKQN